jgi:hypothetical protein
VPNALKISLTLTDNHHLPIPAWENAFVTIIESPVTPPDEPDGTFISPPAQTDTNIPPHTPEPGKLEHALHGWVARTHFNPHEVILTVLPLSSNCEISFVIRAFDKVGGETVMLGETSTNWSIKNCVSMRRPLAEQHLPNTVWMTYSAMLRTLGSEGPITDFRLDGGKVTPLALPALK